MSSETENVYFVDNITQVVVMTPKDYQGQITGNISSKRGVIEDTTEDRGVAQVSAKIPLANLFGYTSDLRSATKGQASFSMEFSHYAPVPVELADLPPGTVRGGK